MKTTDWTRRNILLGSTAWAAAHSLRAADAPPRKAAIIGHTGAGDYGHGIEHVFNGLPNVSVVAVADPNEAGRTKAKAACGAARDYADFRAMLDKEKPDLVAIGPRWATEHHAMALAALQAGAHLYLEKPFTVTLAEGDEILRLAKEQQRRIAVAHVARMAPSVLRLEKALREGLIGEVLEIHTVGKMGSRAGGQDMMVLGLHVFDLTRLFGGEVQWCQARIRLQGKTPTSADAKESPADKVGPVVGDDIFASFAMDSGVNVTFRSRVGLEKAAGPFGMEIIGSKGVIRLNSGAVPTLSILTEPNRAATTRTESWKDWNGGIDPATEATIDGITGYDAAHRRVVRDWLRAIDENREPLGSGERAMKAIEMAHGVFQAGMTGQRVEFPLVRRTHPLVAA
ncbi:MAG: Gfo/Idh/MocA family protein [Prosthecobacter sp.]|uniref:Gfo/Idh/MocA family protein n=1 Tax=Prosthecobacter sp. TaxID=1965333 RepID=UPI0039023450